MGFKTAAWYRSSLMEKAGAGNVVQLVGWSVKNGFASLLKEGTAVMTKSGQRYRITALIIAVVSDDATAGTCPWRIGKLA
jgi:hypothetical protein